MREEARQILDALSTLKPSDQEVLRLSIWEGLSTEDVALTLDVSADATRQRLSRARRNLAREYDRIDSTLKLSPIARKGGAL